MPISQDGSMRDAKKYDTSNTGDESDIHQHGPNVELPTDVSNVGPANISGLSEMEWESKHNERGSVSGKDGVTR